MPRHERLSLEDVELTDPLVAHAGSLPTYQFPPFSLDVREQRLLVGSEPVVLKPKAFRLLLRLLENGGQLLTKQELLRDVWRDVKVSDAVLKVCVREIRVALGDHSSRPRFIQTVHGRGYRFIGEVHIEFPLPRSRCQVRRDGELVRLERTMNEVEQGHSRLLLISGEPGIGKTSLLESFLRAIDGSKQCWIAHGYCSRPGQREAYMPLLEGLGRIGRGGHAERFTSQLTKHAPLWASRLAGISGESASTQQPAEAVCPGRMLRELGDLIETLSRQWPFVLALEDLHNSDNRTLECIEYLARRRANARLMLIGTIRSPRVELKRWLHEAPAVLGCLDWEVLEVRALSPSEVTSLLRARFGSPEWITAVASRLHQVTLGHPWLVNGMLQHLERTQSIGLVGCHFCWRENPQTWQLPHDLRAFTQTWRPALLQTPTGELAGVPPLREARPTLPATLGLRCHSNRFGSKRRRSGSFRLKLPTHP